MKLFNKTAALLTAAVLLFNGFCGVLADEQQEIDLSNPAERELLEQQQKEQEEAQQREQEEQATKQTVSKIERKKYITALNEVINSDLSETELILNRFKALNIIDSVDELAPDGICTRGQYFDMLARVIAGGEELEREATEFEFKDVPDGHRYYNSVSYLQNRHYVSGYEDGNLLPDEAISYNDAIMLTVKALGYSSYAEYMGGMYAGYLNVAARLELTKGISTAENDGITVASVVKLIDKALETKVAALDYMTEKQAVYAPSNDTLLYRNFELTYVSGVVTKNSRTALSSKAGIGEENIIQIADITVDFSDTDINADSYLGLYCEVLYDADSLKGAYIDYRRNRNNVLTLTADEIYEYDSVGGLVLYERDGNYKKQLVPKDISIIFNGRAVEGNIDERMFTPDIGELAFIDNDRDGSYECLIIDSFSVYISAFNGVKVNDIISDKNGVQTNIDVEAAEQLTVYKNDAPALVTDIAINDVLLVESDCYSFEKNGNYSYVKVDAEKSSYYRVIATSEVLSEKVKRVTKFDISLEKFKARLSEQYEVARLVGKNSLTSTVIKDGISGNFGLDAYGNIVYLNKTDDTRIRYGYLITVKAPEAEGFGDNRVKLFTEDGEMLVTKLASKVKVHNKWSDGELSTATYFPKTLRADDFLKINGVTSGGKFNSQLVKFALNTDGDVREIYLTAMATKNYKTMLPPLSDENILECVADYSNGASCVYANSITMGFDFTFGFGTHTIGFRVPDDTAGAADSNYKVLRSSPYSNGAVVNNAMLYGVATNGCVDVMVQKVKKSNAVIGSSMTGTNIYKTLLLGSVDRELDLETQEMNTTVSGYNMSGKNSINAVTYSFANQELCSQFNASNPATGEVFRPETSGVKIEDLQAGDIIEVVLDGDNQISGFKVLWKGIADEDVEPQKGEWLWNTNNWTLNANGTGQLPLQLNNATYGGRVEYCRGGIIFVDTGRDDGRYRRITEGSYSPTTLYDVKTEQHTVISPSEIREGDYVYWNTRSQAIVCLSAIRR